MLLKKDKQWRPSCDIGEGKVAVDYILIFVSHWGLLNSEYTELATNYADRVESHRALLSK